MVETAKPVLKPVTIAQLRDLGAPLLAAHYREVALDQTVPLAPNWPVYEELEQRDLLVSIGAWADDRLVGYAVSIFERHLHYDIMVLRNDVLFVLPEFRGAGIGLIRAVEEEARAAGCNVVAWHAKKDTALDTILARRDGYRVQDIIYTRKV